VIFVKENLLQGKLTAIAAGFDPALTVEPALRALRPVPEHFLGFLRRTTVHRIAL